MNRNEEILQKLRDFRMDKILELKNDNSNINIDIEDVIYCGEIEFEHNNSITKQDVFLVIKKMDENIRLEYYTQNDFIAIEYNEMIIPTTQYKEKDLKQLLKNQQDRISLNELEKERIKKVSKVLGIESNEINNSGEIDTKNLTEEAILEKNIFAKTECNINEKITATENFRTLIPGVNKFEKVIVVNSTNSNDKFKFVGITSDGKIEEINSLISTEGNNPTQKTISSNRDGSNIEEKNVSAMYKIKGRENEGFSINIGQYGNIEVNYMRRSNSNEYLTIPIETTTTKRVNSDLKRDMDKTKNIRVDEELDRAKEEFKEHNGKTNWRNIDDNPNNDIEHDDVIIMEKGEEIYLKKEAKKAKVSIEEFKRIYKSQSENLTPEQRLEATHEEIEEQFIGKTRNR